VVIIDLDDPETVIRRPITADNAIMHPEKKVIALKGMSYYVLVNGINSAKAGKQLQVFNLESKQKLKSYLMPEDVLFWKWLGPAVIGLVTEHSVFHWHLEEGSEGDPPKKVFDRHSSLTGCQIINYRSDSSGRWLLLVGITAQQGRVVGAMQLYNVDKNVSQPIEGHAGVFAEFMLPDGGHATKAFAFAVRTATAAKLNIVEIDHREGSPAYAKKALDLYFPPDAPNDFPVSMQVSDKYGLVYVVTKYGFIHIYDLVSGACVYMNRISVDTIFVTVPNRSGTGILGINRKGQVLSVTIDEDSLVPYLIGTLGNPDLALHFAAQNGLGGADDLFAVRFGQFLAVGQFVEAAKLAARSPRGILRTQQTIEALKAAPIEAGEMSPLLQYFGILLEGAGTLNRHESIELAKPVLTQGKKPLLEKWLKDNKLECSEDLGDIVRQFDVTLALSVYLRADVPGRVCECFAELGQFGKIILFARKVGYEPDYMALINLVLAVDPSKAAELAKALLEDGQIVLDLDAVFDLFASQGLVQQATFFILDRLKQDTPDLGPLQTRLLSLNLERSPQVANAILEARMLSHYDKALIGGLCEQAGLYQRALEHLSEPSDMVRALTGVPEVDPDWLVSYLSNVEQSSAVALLKGLLNADFERYIGLATKVAVKLGPAKLHPANVIDLFLAAGAKDALFLYLGALLGQQQSMKAEPVVLMAYIQMAVETGHLKELERICREGTGFDADAAIKYLQDAKLADPLPLIILCDRFGQVHDLILHLYERGDIRYIEVYVQKVNPGRAPDVVAALLDVGCAEAKIQELMLSLQASSKYSMAALVRAVEERNRLTILLPLLEARIRSADNQDPELYNALAKIYVDQNRGAEEFLLENSLYDTAAIGRYCEKRNPHLALIAFEKGRCDKELLALTNENGMFKQQARYLLHRKDLALWAFVLEPGNSFRPQLLEQAVGVVIPESSAADEVSLAVKALMAASLSKELVVLLERLLLEGTAFAQNKNLQNLLLQTAIKAAPERVSDLLGRLKNYDSVEVGRAALAAGLFEEAFLAHKLAGRNAEAVGVLVEHLKDCVRGATFAELVNEKETWSRLGRGQRMAGLIKESIESYLKAEDPGDHAEVIRAAGKAGRYEDLVRFLTMAKGKVRDQLVESELLFALAMTNRLGEIEAFVARPNIAQIQGVAERCEAARLYAAARILYTAVANYAKLATCLVHLRDFPAAVECARKANSLRVWQGVLEACLEEGEYALAQTCGTHLVVHADELDRLVKIYEERGLFAEAIELLESSLNLERSHMGIFTELAALLARHRPERLMDHLTLYWSRINIPKTIAACAEAHLWSPLVFLYLHHDDHDRAVAVMVEHPVETWEHDRLSKALQRISNPETLYRAIDFYHAEHPLMLPELLMLCAPRLDPGRVVDLFRKAGQLALIRPYLVAIQGSHISAVNNALNELLLAEEDAAGLAASFDRSDRFDTLALAAKLGAHPRLDIRRLAARLLALNGQWREAIAALQRDALHTEAIRTAAASRDQLLAEDLLYALAHELGSGELFVGALYACLDLVRPDVVLQLAWEKGWVDLAMPFLCQSLRALHDKIGRLDPPQPAAQNERPRSATASHAASLATSAPSTPRFPLAK
jgi:clathrin heavy chain